MTLAFAESEYAQRVERVREALFAQGLDALIVTQPENICYLSGYWTPGYHVFQALAVPRRGEPFLVVRNIEVDNVLSRAWFKRHYPIDNLDLALETFVQAMRSEGLESGTVGIEVDCARQSMTRTDLLADALPSIRWVPSLGVVEHFRAIKSEAEIDHIRRALRMAEAALSAGARSIVEGVTDSEVAAAVQAELARQEIEFTGSPPYVVGGAASANRPQAR